MTKRAPDDRIMALVAEGLTNEQLADALGVTDRTLCRWRAASPSLNAAIIAERKRQNDAKPERPHGTATRYNKGCRCDECRESQSARHYEWSLRAQQFATRYGRRAGRTPSVRPVRREASRVVPTRERIEQAIAAGRPTTIIMADLDVSYAAVQDVREAMEQAATG